MLIFLLVACANNVIETPVVEPQDIDNDGQTVDAGDCDDTDDYVAYGFAHKEKDQACYRDRDGDGFGARRVLPPVEMGTDCDDSDPYTKPMMSAAKEYRCMKDADADGYGSNVDSRLFEKGWDCDDSDPKITPYSKSIFNVYDCPGPNTEEQRVVKSTPEILEKLWSTSEDKKPIKLDGVGKEQEGLHYVTSNEGHPYQFKTAIADLGGGYLGVGTDQAYLLIGWQKPEFAWLFDYDIVVKRLHELYSVYFLAAETPEQFLAYWNREPNDSEIVDIIEKSPFNQIEKSILNKTALKYQKKVRERLNKMNAQLNDHKIESYLNSNNQYTYIRALINAQKVRPLLGNLNDNVAMSEIGKVAQDLNIPIKVLYVSNAEQYWNYSEQFKRNVKSLPIDDNSLILRTLLNWAHNQDYHYVVQSQADFRLWLQQDGIDNIRDIVKRRADKSSDILYTFFKDTPPLSP